MTADESALIHNPYVGPRSFQEGERDRFFGRDLEARDLLAQVLSERLVVFYAQSGAGKSSLINARLITGLRDEQFDVLPVGRVSGAVPVDIHPKNVFVFNLIARLELQDHPSVADPPRSAAALSDMSLAEFLGADDAAADADGFVTAPSVLIVDQFEEIFTTQPEQWQARADFFGQLKDAQEIFPSLWVVLAMREDYIAQLDPFAHLLPNRLHNRFYMQRMSASAALEAVKRPAQAAGHSFATGVADMLVDNLRQLRQGPATDGVADLAQGQFVEPVQLQVVCYQLWERLRESDALADAASTISDRSLELVVGDRPLSDFVNHALGDYYEQALTRVLATDGIDVNERELRDWFSNELITPDGTRGLAFQASHSAGRLPITAVRLLADQFLIRAEERGGGVFYELVHDRFVQPIVESNRAWMSAQTNPVSTATRLWLANNRDPGRLLTGPLLADAQRFAEAKPRELGDDERTFLDASFRQQAVEAERAATRQRELAEERARRAETQIKAERRFRWLALVLGLVAMLAVGATALAVQQSQQAGQQRLQAIAAQTTAEANRQLAVTAESTAIAAQATAVAAGQAEAAARLMVMQQSASQIAVLSTQVTTLKSSAGKTSSTDAPLAQTELKAAIATATAFAPAPVRATPVPTPVPPPLSELQWNVTAYGRLGGGVYSATFNFDGTRIATASNDGFVQVWDSGSGRQLFTPFKLGATANRVLFSPNGNLVATASDDGTLLLWDALTGAKVAGPASHPSQVKDIAFNTMGTRIASVDKVGVVRVWDGATLQQVGTDLPGVAGELPSVAFSREGNLLAAAGTGPIIYLWDADLRKVEPPIDSGYGKEPIDFIAFSPDGKTLAVAGNDGTVTLIALDSRQSFVIPMDNQDAVFSVDFSPDARRLVTASHDGTATVWDAGTGRKLATLPNPTGPSGEPRSAVFDASFNPHDGKQVVTASDDGFVRLWSEVTMNP